jgi:predicted CXXCH cytochrome family protein
MKIYGLKTMSLPKIAVLATGLAAAVLAVTMSPQVAQAFPSRARNCAGCHTGSTSTATTATPSTTTPAAGATYTVAITLAANPTGGNSGYAIIPVTAGTGTTFAGDTGPLLSYTATMTAAAAGAYSYTVYTNQGSQATGKTGSATYSITVSGTATTPPATTTSTPPVTTTSAPPVTTPPATTTGIHGPYSISSAQCGTCHRAHTAKAKNLLKVGTTGSLGSQSTLCLGCHDGAGASPVVKMQYDLVRPANNATTREYYSHDATAVTPPVTAHTLSGENEFGDKLNRHSECADCHNSHQATATAARDSAQTASGWDPSRRLAGVSGVSVVNGAAGAAPAYTFRTGTTDSVIDPITLEYQLCFKCHSGFTTLPPPIANKASKDYLDKAVEFNPANSSFHPVEAAGKNTTAAMAASLKGASTYKLWNFETTSTIRCLNCHASSATAGSPLPQPGTALAPHTSSNRGILIRNYKDRVLKPKSGTDAAYSAGDFALCYVCHGQAPFAPGASSDPQASLQTNFSYHSKHVSGIAGEGSVGTDIDTPSDGGGNAICAECHFRLHSTTNKVGAQTLTGDPTTGSRLVNFAPNVTASGGVISWTSTGTGSGSCTLTCHGKRHNGYDYN